MKHVWPDQGFEGDWWRALRLDGGAKLRAEEHRHVTAGILCSIKRKIGSDLQKLRIGSMIRCDRDPDAGANRRDVPVQVEWLAISKSTFRFPASLDFCTNLVNNA